MTDTRGFTAYVCVGPWGGIGVRRERTEVGTAFRLVLGWVSFCLATFDAERFIGMASRALRECREIECRTIHMLRETATGAECATDKG